MNDSTSIEPTGLACAVCGNTYDKAFTVTRGDVSLVFDSFECASQAMAPVCANCGVRILGHGVENADAIYCCAHCARAQGERELVDRER